jgi:hypothetical protein
MTIAEDQLAFYGGLIATHGDDPRALAHRDQATQYERFRRLAKVFDGATSAFTVHEVGCGMGHFGEYLRAHHPVAEYSGSDIHPAFTEACRQKFPGARFETRDIEGGAADSRADYVTLSGTFNPRLSASEDAWRSFVQDTLRAMYAMCTRGIAVNFLTSFSDPERMDAQLHYQSPSVLLEFVTSELSRFWSLDAGGPLYEFTLCVHRPEHVRALHPASEFDRYFKRSP